MTEKELKAILKKPFIITWWPTDCYAHGNYDFEHYYVKWYDPVTMKQRETEWCEGGCGSRLPFENPESEFYKFDSMGQAEYWKSYGVPDEWIKQMKKEK